MKLLLAYAIINIVFLVLLLVTCEHWKRIALAEETQVKELSKQLGFCSNLLIIPDDPVVVPPVVRKKGRII